MAANFKLSKPSCQFDIIVSFCIYIEHDNSGGLTKFMAQVLTNDDWFALLRDIDGLEKDCATGFMGSYHINIPYIGGLKSFSKGEADFYKEKAILYEGPNYLKGPFTTFMSRYMKSAQWLKFLLHYDRQSVLCRKILGDQVSISQLLAVMSFLSGQTCKHNSYGSVQFQKFLSNRNFMRKLNIENLKNFSRKMSGVYSV